MTDRFGSEELIQRTDKAGLGVINTGVLNKAIADASDEIDAYLSNYSLPLAVVPPPLVRISCDIARYHLYPDMFHEIAFRNYDKGIEFLKMIQSGKIKLGNNAAGTQPQAESGPVLVSEYPSIFGRDSFDGW